MAHTDEDRKELGQRLAAARKLAGYTTEAAAKALTDRGHPITKQGVGHWETGRNVPDAIALRRLAKLYGTTADSLLWAESVSMEGIRFAVQYDALDEKQKRTFRAMWLAYFQQTTSDEEVEEHFPAAPQTRAPHPN